MNIFEERVKNRNNVITFLQGIQPLMTLEVAGL